MPSKKDKKLLKRFSGDISLNFRASFAGIDVINKFQKASGCGSVGRAVASDTRDPRFESNHLHITFIFC